MYCYLQPTQSKNLSTIQPSTEHNKRYGNIILYETAVFTVKKTDHYGNRRCPIAFILPFKALFS